jgi:Protein of unknown function (DUF3306)
VAPDGSPEAAAPLRANEGAALAETGITAEEIAALPSLEELTAETDMSGFLRKGVPEPLRNAALRRMWSLDPKIRDFVCEAREYAYDWNTPGGVPGSSGPLPAAEDIARMAARIVGGEQAEADRAGVDKPRAAANSSSQKREQTFSETLGAPDTTAVAPEENRRLAKEETPLDAAAAQADVIASRPPPQADTRQESLSATEPPRTDGPASVGPRRHGGAVPV